MSDLRLVVFDCDGTLVDSLHMIVHTMTAAYASHDEDAPADHEVRQHIGLSLEVVIDKLSPHFGQEKCHAVAASYRDHFHELRRKGEMTEPLFDGARQAIERLDEAGVLMAMATGKGMRGLHHVLDQHEMRQYFTSLQTPDTAPGKPHPGMVENVLEETGVLAANTLVLGDTSFDMEMARNAGVAAIGVDWGYHHSDTLMAAGADRVLRSFSELPDLLAEMS